MARISYTRQHHNHYYRYLNFMAGNPCAIGAEVGDLTPGDTNVTYYAQINIPHTLTLDGLYYRVGNAAGAGNVKLALYRDNGGVPDGGALVAQTLGAAQPAAGNVHIIATTIVVQAALGLCWVAICNDTAGARYRIWSGSDAAGIGWARRSLAEAYATFPTDPCPATAEDRQALAHGIRVLSVP